MNKSIKDRYPILATTLSGIVAVIADSDGPLLATSAEANMHIDEGIKALQGGDTQAAMTHLKAADGLLSPGEAKMHLDKGIKAL